MSYSMWMSSWTRGSMTTSRWRMRIHPRSSTTDCWRFHSSRSPPRSTKTPLLRSFHPSASRSRLANSSGHSRHRTACATMATPPWSSVPSAWAIGARRPRAGPGGSKAHAAQTRSHRSGQPRCDRACSPQAKGRCSRHATARCLRAMVRGQARRRSCGAARRRSCGAFGRWCGGRPPAGDRAIQPAGDPSVQPRCDRAVQPEGDDGAVPRIRP